MRLAIPLGSLLVALVVSVSTDFQTGFAVGSFMQAFGVVAAGIAAWYKTKRVEEQAKIMLD